MDRDRTDQIDVMPVEQARRLCRRVSQWELQYLRQLIGRRVEGIDVGEGRLEIMLDRGMRVRVLESEMGDGPGFLEIMIGKEQKR